MEHPAQEDRIHSLDGIRAFAILTVILAHLEQRFWFIPFPVQVADGVQLFFVLSGFLITGILLRQRERAGGIRLGYFYRRRATRILPPLLGYLGTVVAICIGCHISVPWPALGRAALFVTSVHPADPTGWTSHLWTLAVEEQFYVLWPLLLLLCFRWGGVRAARYVAAALLFASPLFRITVGLLHAPAFYHREGFVLPGRMDSLFAGALLALSLETVTFVRWYERLKRFAWFPPLFLAVLSPLLRMALGSAYTYTAGFTVESLMTAALIASLLRAPESRTARVLSWWPVTAVGVASYSIYLYQSAVIFFWPTWFWPTWAGGLGPVFLFVLAFAVGFLAYGVVEVPLAKLRRQARRPGPLLPEAMAPVNAIAPSQETLLS